MPPSLDDLDLDDEYAGVVDWDDLDDRCEWCGEDPCECEEDADPYLKRVLARPFQFSQQAWASTSRRLPQAKPKKPQLALCAICKVVPRRSKIEKRCDACYRYHRK